MTLRVDKPLYWPFASMSDKWSFQIWEAPLNYCAIAQRNSRGSASIKME